MHRRIAPSALLFALLLAPFALASFARVARAVDAYAVGSLTIEHPWAWPTDELATTAAVYFELKNGGDAADRLVAARTEAAEETELHRTVNDAGMLRMPAVQAIEVPAKGSVSVKPGAYHVMLLRLKAPLKAGQRFPLRLTFEKAGTVTVEVVVDKAGGSPGAMPMDHEHPMGPMEHGHGGGM